MFDERLDFLPGREGGDSSGAEQVESRLDHDRADGSDGELEAHRNAEPDFAHGNTAVREKIPEGEPILRHFCVHVDGTKGSGDSLRENRGPRSSRYAHIK